MSNPNPQAQAVEDPTEPQTEAPKVEAIDPARHQALASAHERLKRDAAADRAAKADLEARLAAYDAEKAAAEEAKAREAGDFDTVKKQLEERYKKEVTVREQAISKQRTQIERLVIDAGLAQAIADVGVAPEFVKMATAFLRQGVEITDDADGNPVALRNGAPIAEAVRLWAENEGKAVIRNGNNGGGAQGGAGSPNKKTYTLAEFKALDPKTQAAKAAEPGFTLTD